MWLSGWQVAARGARARGFPTYSRTSAWLSCISPEKLHTVRWSTPVNNVSVDAAVIYRYAISMLLGAQ